MKKRAPAKKKEAPAQPTVLIVDDEPSIRMLYRSALKALPVRLLDASNGLDAMNLIEQKIKAGGKKLEPVKAGEKPTPVIDLVSILQQSIAKAAEGGSPRKKPAAKSRGRAHRKAA